MSTNLPHQDFKLKEKGISILYRTFGMIKPDAI